MAFKMRRRSIWRNIALFVAILGPGIITGSVDNDAGGITTYSVAGALYGYNLIWTRYYPGNECPYGNRYRERAC
jgi:Mn2+/Fe2+ NRAMP family transporter